MEIHALSTLALEKGKWIAYPSDRFTPGPCGHSPTFATKLNSINETTSGPKGLGACRIGECVNPKAGLDTVVLKRKIGAPFKK
jgi:hypothetical protein